MSEILVGSLRVNGEQIVNGFNELLEERVGFIGPFIVKQQTKDMNLKTTTTLDDCRKLITSISEAVEGLFGKENARKISEDLSHILKSNGGPKPTPSA